MREKRTNARIELFTLAIIVIVVVLAIALSCERTVDVALFKKLRLDMSEQEVIKLLGKPNAVQEGEFGLTNLQSKTLYYKRSDGKRWAITIEDYRDQLVVAGEAKGESLWGLFWRPKKK